VGSRESGFGIDEDCTWALKQAPQFRFSERAVFVEHHCDTNGDPVLGGQVVALFDVRFTCGLVLRINPSKLNAKSER
jgi:hypothetical protein